MTSAHSPMPMRQGAHVASPIMERTGGFDLPSQSVPSWPALARRRAAVAWAGLCWRPASGIRALLA